MSLARYHEKRDFQKTPEPSGKTRRAKSGQRTQPAKAAVQPLSFVIQKHDARRLHYDFRLEADGVLKSWAVPKGPSLDPAVKRLAIEVEDHPLDYGGFEGNIPEHEYGAGAVLVWDCGTWTLTQGTSFDQAYRAGKIEFELSGEKLHGGWVLVRTHSTRNARQPEWLLMKRRDEFARHDRSEIVSELERSVLSGRTIADVAANRTVRSKSGDKEQAALPARQSGKRTPEKSRARGASAPKRTRHEAIDPQRWPRRRLRATIGCTR